MADVQQIPLGLRWSTWQGFEDFDAGANGVALAACKRLARDADAPWLLLQGPHASGKSHLLLATCQALNAAGAVAQYRALAALPLRRAEALRAEHGAALIALDDLDAIAGDAEAEHALFDLYNRSRADGTRLLLSATRAPAALGIGLPDLASRLGQMTRLVLHPLDEPARRNLLRQRAARRGIELDDAVLDWLFRYHARDLASLGALLEELDRATLAEHRRVTVPFLREILRRRE